MAAFVPPGEPQQYPSSMDMDMDMGYEDPDQPSSSTSLRTHTARRHARASRGDSNNTRAPFDVSFRPGRLMLYSRPRQRQSWGDTQVLPRVDWGDLFFDLFYVAATYNVSYILVDDPTALGLLYALGTFWPVMGLWLDKLYYDARFVTEDDIYHRLFIMAGLVTLATAVLDIRSVEQMSHPAESSSMFVFSLSLVIFHVLHSLRTMETFFLGVGSKTGIQHAATRDIRWHAVSFVCNLAACIVAGLEYYGNGSSGSDYRRVLAGGGGSDEFTSAANHIPISLTLAGFVANQLTFAFEIIFCFPKNGQHKEVMIPVNVDFVIHRNGEWIMLMLGESIFSLLIVDVPNETAEFYGTFYCGILTVTFLQYLHFRSQPHSADHHAVRRDMRAAITWNMLQFVYSIGLVGLGAAYTFFLTDVELQASSIGYESDGYATGNYTTAYNDTATYDGSADDTHRRWLAGSGESKDEEDAEHRRQSGATMFAASLAVVFFCLDVINICHVGWKEGKCRVYCKKSHKKNKKGLLVLLFRFALFAFTATLSLWENDPLRLSFIGVILVLAQLLVRRMGARYLYERVGDELELEGDEASWPNVTHARAEPSGQVERGAG